MSPAQTRVAIVVTEIAEADVATLVSDKNVWVADTPLNWASAKAIWQSGRPQLHEITTFKVDWAAPRDEWVVAISR